MVKKFIVFIFIFIASIVYLNVFLQEQNKNYLKLTTTGQTENAWSVVFSTDISSDDEIYDILADALRAFHGNLYCFDVETVDGKSIYTKYILVNDFALFDTLLLKEGRFFSVDETEGDYFISTDKTNSPNQIGVIDTFDKDTDFQFKTLKNYVDNTDNAFQKMFVFELKNTDDYPSFSKRLKDNGIVITLDAIHSSTLNMAPYIVLLVFSTIIVLTLIILYKLIKMYKHIGVEKMLGYDTFTVWCSRIPKLVLTELSICLIVAIILTAFSFHTLNILVLRFLGKVVFIYLLIAAFTLGMTSLPFIYVCYIPVNAIVKNRKPFKAVTRFNFFVKVIILSILLTVSLISYNQLQLITSQKNDAMKNWEKILDYVYVYKLSYTDDTFDSSSQESIEKWKNIYFDFNKSGAIMANFSGYSPLYAEEKAKSEFPLYCDVIVNPNYLEMFPIKDLNGNNITISEQDSDYIVLLPEKYKDREQELRDYYEFIKTSYSGKEEEMMKNKKLKFIWMENNQWLFSCRVDVGVEHNNAIQDPLVVVLTEANGAAIDYFDCVGSRYCPFKIKVTDITNPLYELNQVFSRYFDLEVFSFPYISIRQSIEDQVEMANEELRIYIGGIMLLFAMGLAIIMQNIVAYMEQYKKVLAVKKFMGYHFWDRYNGYFGFSVIGYVLSGAIALLIAKDTKILFFVVFYFLIEFGFSIIYIHIKDKANMISITKGG
ncbi:MAG: DUF1430 domain-containing protein [Clostridium sp.]|nr:DUF1430 domain-containing protein [Clostridium sp.]